MKFPLTGCGVIAVLWGLLCSCGGVGMIVDPKDGASRIDGVLAGGLFGGIPLLMGVGMVAAAIVLQVKEKRRDAQLAWLRTRDRLTVDEFAQAHGIGPSKAEGHLLSLLQHPGAPALVYHRKRKEYVQRGSIEGSGRMVDRCPSCHSPQNILLLAGESGTCTACGATL